MTATYDPVTEGSTGPAAEAARAGRPVTVILTGPGLCQCGCEGSTKARFTPGHDMRLKGLLRRALHADGRFLIVTPGGQEEMTAEELVAHHGWQDKINPKTERPTRAKKPGRARGEDDWFPPTPDRKMPHPSGWCLTAAHADCPQFFNHGICGCDCHTKETE